MSEAATEAGSYIAAHRPEARGLGLRLAELIDDPEAFTKTLREGLRDLADPAYAVTVARVSPGSDTTLAVRGPLVAAIERPLHAGLREVSTASALWLAQRLARCEERDMRLFATPCLERSFEGDRERSWQLLREMGRRAGDWIETDSLADLWSAGVLAEPFRWAELEQLVYSQRAMERRLVGSTLARMPHQRRPRERGALRGVGSEPALGLVGQLIGDAEPMVQKSLSWALREWTPVDPDRVRRFLMDQTSVAVEQHDGLRAWVIRDSLSAQPDALAGELRDRLTGIRRERDARPTSHAAAQAAAFAPAVRSHASVERQGDRYTRTQP